MSASYIEVIDLLGKAAGGETWAIQSADTEMGKLTTHSMLGTLAVIIASRPFASQMRNRPALVARFLLDIECVFRHDMMTVLELLEGLL